MSVVQLYPEILNPYLYLHPIFYPHTQEAQELLGTENLSYLKRSEIAQDLTKWANDTLQSIFNNSGEDLDLECKSYSSLSFDIHTDRLQASYCRVTIRIAPQSYPKCGTLFLKNTPIYGDYWVKRMAGEYLLYTSQKSVSTNDISSDSLVKDESFKAMSAGNGQLAVFRDVLHGAPPTVHLPVGTPTLFIRSNINTAEAFKLPRNMFINTEIK